MRGYSLHRVLAAASTFLDEGAVRGRLLEIYRLDDPELLPVLDREEGYNFERRRAIVTLANGRRARAWIYRYRGPQTRAVPIPDGDYRRVHPRSVTGERQWR